MTGDLAARITQLDWPNIRARLDARGYATTGPLLDAHEVADLAASFDNERLFRSQVIMSRHGFGQGEYRYFAYPLPDVVETLRQELYPRLLEVANAWHETLQLETRFPPSLTQMLARCHAAGQKRPTPLILKYGAGDYNCLHQDLYGEHVFPLQAAFLLSAPGPDFEGGEFVLVEQRPRQQSRPQVVALRQGEAVLFAVKTRPMQGTRGPYRVQMRHGVSTITRGQRYTAGIIFHDAQ